MGRKNKELEGKMEEFLKNITTGDIEKFRLLHSIIADSKSDKEDNQINKSVTLKIFIDEYLSMVKANHSKSYYESVGLAIKHLTRYIFIRDGIDENQRAINSIQLKEFEDFIIYLRKKASKGYVVYYRNLKAAFNKAKDWGYIKENYLTKVKLPKKQKLIPAFINSEQLLAISSKIKSEVVKDVVVFAFYTGMRLNEIVNLCWDNVDLQNNIITIGDERFVTKGRNQRFVPVCKEAKEVLVRRRAIMKPLCSLDLSLPNQVRNNFLKKEGEFLIEYVFSKRNGERFTGDHFSRRFKIVCKAAGLDNSIHFHSLRHSFASNLVQHGVPLYTIKELLGHSSISTTEIYSHLNMETLRKAVGKLDTPHTSLITNGEGVKQPNIYQITSREVK